MVLVQDPARLDDVEGVVRGAVPGHLDHPVEVGADPAVLRVLRAHPLQAVDLALRLLADGLGHAGGGDLGAVLADDVVLAFAQFLADGVHLHAQEVLALRLVEALGDVGADLVLERILGQGVTAPGDQLHEALLQVGGLQDLHLLLGAHDRRVADRVGDLPRVRHPPQEPGRVLRPTLLKEIQHDRLVLAGQFQGPGARVVVPAGLDLDAQSGAVGGHARTDDAAGDPSHDDDRAAVGQSSRVLDLGDGADPGERPVDPRDDEQHARCGPLACSCGLEGLVGFAALHGQGDAHVGKDDRTIERQDGQHLRVNIHLVASLSMLRCWCVGASPALGMRAPRDA